MLAAASPYLYLKPGIKTSPTKCLEESKEPSWEVDLNQLDTNFDSDSESNTDTKNNDCNENPVIIYQTKEFKLPKLEEIKLEINKIKEKMKNRHSTNLKNPEIVSSDKVNSATSTSASNTEKSTEKDKNSSDKSQKSQKYKVEVDTNVMTVQLDALSENVDTISSKPIFCEGCTAILNKYSKIVKNDFEDQIWKCEFCNLLNKISISPEQIPENEIIDYELESTNDSKINKNEQSNSAIIFCLDISSSMNSVRYTNSSSIISYAGSSQLRDSSLNLMKKAIESQLNLLKESTKIVGIITFSSKIICIGDSKAQKIDDESFDDYDKLCDLGTKFASQNMIKSVNETHDYFQSALEKIKANGCTALGPAAVISVAAAASKDDGSRVIICTDGLSNKMLYF